MCTNEADPGDFSFTQLDTPESGALDNGLWWYPTALTEMPAGSTDLELAISCGAVSCLFNTEPLELLRLQPSELIASESVAWKASANKNAIGIFAF